LHDVVRNSKSDHRRDIRRRFMSRSVRTNSTKLGYAAIFFIGSVIVSDVNATTLNFDQDAVGLLPSTWVCGSTGGGSPRWTVEADLSAPSKSHVLQQSGVGPFPWCVVKGTSLTDGALEVKFRPVAGRRDQAGGLVWRWKDGDNYYVARANALENNVSLYYTLNGRRNTIKYVDAPVAANVWHSLRVEFTGKRIQVSLNGKAYIDLEDDRIVGPGAVGVWTKADSTTRFDDFSYSPTR
jgi:hypothetical protein